MHRTIPIIKLYDNLLVSIQVDLSDQLVLELQEGLASEIRRLEPTGLIIELSSVETFDSYIARCMRDIAQVARLMGVRTLVAGFDPATATTLVEMGIGMHGVDTTLNLETALEVLAAEKLERKERDRLCAEMVEFALPTLTPAEPEQSELFF